MTWPTCWTSGLALPNRDNSVASESNHSTCSVRAQQRLLTPQFGAALGSRTTHGTMPRWQAQGFIVGAVARSGLGVDLGWALDECAGLCIKPRD